MKFLKWRIWFVTIVVCIAPVILGVAVWEKLPDSMAVHFNIHNQADGFSSKAFAVFGLPVLMVILQTVCCLINDINAAKHGERRKLELATKWIIPIMSLLLYVITMWINLGNKMDVRRIVCIIVGAVFLLIGNYLPKFDYVKNYDIDTEKARKINRFIGFATVLMGVVMIASTLLPPAVSVIALLLLIPYAVVNLIYGIYVGRGE